MVPNRESVQHLEASRSNKLDAQGTRISLQHMIQSKKKKKSKAQNEIYRPHEVYMVRTHTKQQCPLCKKPCRPKIFVIHIRVSDSCGGGIK